MTASMNIRLTSKLVSETGLKSLTGKLQFKAGVKINIIERRLSIIKIIVAFLLLEIQNTLIEPQVVISCSSTIWLQNIVLLCFFDCLKTVRVRLHIIGTLSAVMFGRDLKECESGLIFAQLGGRNKWHPSTCDSGCELQLCDLELSLCVGAFEQVV